MLLLDLFVCVCFCLVFIFFLSSLTPQKDSLIVRQNAWGFWQESYQPPCQHYWQLPLSVDLVMFCQWRDVMVGG